MNTHEHKILKRLEKGPSTTWSLLRGCFLGPGQASEALDRLERDGLVQWTRGAWSITPQGSSELLMILPWSARLVCPACLRIRGPIHWAARKIGWCDGS